MEGSMAENKSKSIIQQHKNEGNQWVFNIILKFLQFHLNRVIRKEITGATVRNYLKSIKLFCEMAEFSLHGRKYQEDFKKERTIQMIEYLCLRNFRNCWNTLIEGFKRLYTLWLSSEMRLGAWDYLKWGHIKPILDRENNWNVVAAKIIVYAGKMKNILHLYQKMRIMN